DAPGHRLAATLLKGASRYLVKLCPSHRFSSLPQPPLSGSVCADYDSGPGPSKMDVCRPSPYDSKGPLLTGRRSYATSPAGN
ncbi:MAG TPA: hypothetical protein PK867_06740, partial [Pirellulales bacterium]|nr:hypothetical protein [Pirellulales bacterium]